MQSRRLKLLLTSLSALLLLSVDRNWLAAQEAFFKGKTIRIIVGFSAAAGYDVYARAIARHMPRHIPGNPAVLVENMAGAASLISANHVYKVAKPDGLTIGHFIGGTAPGSATDDIPAVLQAALGLPLQIVSGYKGTAEIRLAAENGEVSGFCTGWESLKSTWRAALDRGSAFIVVQAVPKPHPELPKVPLAINYAKTDEAKKIIQVGAHDPGTLARPFVLPQGTPSERVGVLRKAFADTLSDPEFLAEAKKSNLDISPLSGEEVAKTVDNLFKIEPAIAAKLKQILLPK